MPISKEDFPEFVKKTDPSAVKVWQKFFEMNPNQAKAAPGAPGVKTYSQAEVDAMKKKYEDQIAALTPKA